MPACSISLLAVAALLGIGVAAAALAEDSEAPDDCLGVDFDQGHAAPIARVGNQAPRLYFVKNVYDDKQCPANSDACRQKAYLVPGDLVLLGKSFVGKSAAGANTNYVCAVYEPPGARKGRWTGGWLPSAALAPATPAPAPSRSDWIGIWSHANGHITIAAGRNGGVAIQGEAFYDAAQNVHTGVIEAVATPNNGVLQFADDGSGPFDTSDAGCQVRMRRVDNVLVVEDNNGCGGVMVAFTGFYKRQ
jgi:hypothetical protein